MKKIYEKPEMEINFMEVEDIITASGLSIEATQTNFSSVETYSELF